MSVLPGPAHVPYDRARARVGVVHIGVGGFHRAHQAVYHDRMMADHDALDWGICGIGLLPGDRHMRDALAAQDTCYTLVVRHPDGRFEPRVIGSLLEYLYAPDSPAAVAHRLAAPATRIVSLTVTEGGYDPDGPAFALLADALAVRRARGIPPFAVLSCDNLIGNGAIASAAVVGAARRRDPELAEWIAAGVAFPESVVDRITPASTPQDAAELLDRAGIDDRWPVVCEPFAQWVLEDVISGERPPYEAVGVQLTRAVGPYEAMKLRLLNAGHQAIAYVGLLLGHQQVDEAVGDERVLRFLEGFLDDAAGTLGALPREQVEAFRAAVPGRFANPYIGDTLTRLATDASDRIPKFLLPVIADQLGAGADIRRAAAVVACWAAWLQDAPAVVDRRAQDLVRLARAPGAAFAADAETFGVLATDDRFLQAYSAARSSLRSHGPAATLASLA